MVKCTVAVSYGPKRIRRNNRTTRRRTVLSFTHLLPPLFRLRQRNRQETYNTEKYQGYTAGDQQPTHKALNSIVAHCFSKPLHFLRGIDNKTAACQKAEAPSKPKLTVWFLHYVNILSCKWPQPSIHVPLSHYCLSNSPNRFSISPINATWHF